MSLSKFVDNILSELHTGSVLRVLLVEDDDIDAERVDRILHNASEFQLQRVKSLSKAFPIIARDDVSLVLLDLGLSDCTCLDAIPSLRSLTTAVIVVLSGLDEESSAKKTALENGADRFISKGSDLEDNLRWSMHAAIRGMQQETNSPLVINDTRSV